MNRTRPVSGRGRYRLYCHGCRPTREQLRASDVQLEELVSGSDASPVQFAVLGQLLNLAQVGNWTAITLRRQAAGLLRVLADHPEGQRVRRSLLDAALGAGRARVAASILASCGLLIEDTVPGIRIWVDRQAATLPENFQADVRAWLLALLDGEERARPRSPQTLYAYFGRVRPHLLTWSQTRAHLREVTHDDVAAVLDSLRGHQRVGTFTSLRSLFQFAKRHRLIFADPSRLLSVGQAPKRTVLPMTDEQIATVKEAVKSPAQRLVVGLVAVYAARAKAIRELTVDDIDLPGRAITIGGVRHQLTEFARDIVAAWLEYRHRRWPYTLNRHVLVTTESALGEAPINDYYLTWNLLLRGVQLEHIRADRVLQEALAINADPLHLAMAFGLSTQTAIDYSEIAHQLAARPIEDVDHKNQ
ncbi:site-specific integrase [Saccharomonospora cyanea]|uniref:Core-binding (CB) domain-containing protein n=1 Tax=Saccharomonospora cyanea NA-134 TaxID=882082 RepID=H5XDB2_9PSEU|nr:hypothetical protein [Saccharomonospora cyanea]EHR59192.1 hypothetical protein SaccyDRAFT_0255 [Saccharomonospora cyanea NA-134]